MSKKHFNQIAAEIRSLVENHNPNIGATPNLYLTEMTKEKLVASIEPGDRVTTWVSAGIGLHGQEWKKATGTAVICSGTHAALNMGGKFGIPGVATPENIVSVKKARKNS